MVYLQRFGAGGENDLLRGADCVERLGAEAEGGGRDGRFFVAGGEVADVGLAEQRFAEVACLRGERDAA